MAIRLHRGTDFLAAQGVAAIDVLKVDTQGAEFDVISGLMPLLSASGSGLKILLELTPWSLQRAGASGRELITLLAQLQLPIYIVDHLKHELSLSTPEELCIWCDNVDTVSGDRGFMNILLGNL